MHACACARFIGPMIGATVIAAFGGTWSFRVNLMLRTAVVAALIALRLAPLKRAAPTHGLMDQFMAGVSYAYGFLPSRSALYLFSATSISVLAYPSLMPWFASERLHGDSHTMGLLISASGLGAFTGMAYRAWRPNVRGLFRLVDWTAALIAFSFSSVLCMSGRRRCHWNAAHGPACRRCPASRCSSHACSPRVPFDSLPRRRPAGAVSTLPTWNAPARERIR